VRSARGEPARCGYRCGPVPPDQSLARVAVSPDVGSPVVGSDRSASPGGRRSRASQAIPLGRCPGSGNAAKGMAGIRGQDACAAWSARRDSAGRDPARQFRCSWAELPLRSRHGDLCDHHSGDPLPERLVEGPALGTGRRGLPVAYVPRCALSIGRRRGGGSRHIDRERAQPDLRRAQHQSQHSQSNGFQ
jgi:hypothetical protein